MWGALGQGMHLRQIIASGFGGVLATAVDVASLVLQVKHGTPVALAAFISATLGAAVGFTSNKYLAFCDRTPVTLPQLGRFGIVAVTTALLMALLMELVAVHLRVPTIPAKLVCSALVFAVWTYPAQRRLVFRQPLIDPHRHSAVLPAGREARPSIQPHRHSAVLPAGREARPSFSPS